MYNQGEAELKKSHEERSHLDDTAVEILEPGWTPSFPSVLH